MTRGQWVGLLLLLSLGAVLRLHHLADLPFEQDELYTLRDATTLQSFPEGLSAVSGKPLYYLIQAALLPLLPASELWLRVPPFIFGMLGLWATWALARDRFGAAAGLVAVALLTIAPWHMYVSQFARYWSLLYLLGCLTYLLYFRALERDSPGSYLLAFGAVSVGIVTHPSFVLPMVGFFLGAHLNQSRSRPRVSWPSRAAGLGFWGPLALLVAAAFLALLVTGNEGMLRNRSGRGLLATLRLLPAVVQWLGPATVTAFALAIGALLWLFPGKHGRWATATGLGVAGTIAAMVGLSFWSNIYADYCMAMLPLVFVSIGGALDLASQDPTVRRGLVWSGTLILAASILPSSVSYLYDGNRFDYRPALERIEASRADAPVVGYPVVVLERYAPQLEVRAFTGDVGRLESFRTALPGFWLVTSLRRHGIQPSGPGVSAWIAEHCRLRHATESPRLDYRRYRVELHWCGSGERRSAP